MLIEPEFIGMAAGPGPDFAAAARNSAELIRAAEPFDVTAIRMKYRQGWNSLYDASASPPLPRVDVTMHVAERGGDPYDECAARAHERLLANAAGAYQIKTNPHNEWLDRLAYDFGFHGDKVRVIDAPAPVLAEPMRHALEPSHMSRLARVLNTTSLFLRDVTIACNHRGGAYVDLHSSTKYYPGRAASFLAIQALRGCAEELGEHWTTTAAHSRRPDSQITETVERFAYRAPYGMTIFAYLLNTKPETPLAEQLAVWDGEIPAPQRTTFSDISLYR